MLDRFKDEEGFTLIELLVVILIIGILAAIALPTFLNQQSKGQDASAKSNARNAVTQMETCYADAQSYTTPACVTTGSAWGFPVTASAAGTTQGQTYVDTSTPAGGYTITSVSRSGRNWIITKAAGAAAAYTCTTSCSW